MYWCRWTYGHRQWKESLKYSKWLGFRTRVVIACSVTKVLTHKRDDKSLIPITHYIPIISGLDRRRQEAPMSMVLTSEPNQWTVDSMKDPFLKINVEKKTSDIDLWPPHAYAYTNRRTQRTNMYYVQPMHPEPFYAAYCCNVYVWVCMDTCSTESQTYLVLIN